MLSCLHLTEYFWGVGGVFCYFNVSFHSTISASNGTVGLSLYGLWKSLRRPGQRIRFPTGYKERMGNTISSDMERVCLGKVALLILLKRNDMSKVSVCCRAWLLLLIKCHGLVPVYLITGKQGCVWSLHSGSHTRFWFWSAASCSGLKERNGIRRDHTQHHRGNVCPWPVKPGLMTNVISTFPSPFRRYQILYSPVDWPHIFDSRLGCC